MKYVIYCRGNDKEDAGYWLGGFRENGKPDMGTVTDNALLFDTAREAYAEAGKHKKLQKWRVGARAG
jgi:hypothetical protein